jgi:hypothetical protein
MPVEPLMTVPKINFVNDSQRSQGKKSELLTGSRNDLRLAEKVKSETKSCNSRAKHQ